MTVETDHKPLEVISKKSLLAAPRRLQRMLLQLQRYDLNVMYVPGSQQVLADTLSRAPVETPQENIVCRDEIFHLGLKDALVKELEVISERDFVPISDRRLTAVKEAAKKDVEQAELRKVISEGWPNKIVEVPEGARKYWNFREVLTTQDGVIYKGGQVVVPRALREEFLQCLHSSHQGQESTFRRARDVVYWPGMLEDIKRVTTTCTICEENRPAQAKQDLQAHEVPDQPWAKVGLDLFQSKGKGYLIIVDYLTDFFEICPLSRTLTSDVIGATKEQFARHGIPVVVQSDGGPQFMSHEFQVFACTWGFRRTFSSPYNSQSNGKAESAVKIAKRLLKMCPDPFLALLEWRNTPTAGMGSSPNQRLFSRRTRGGLVTSQERLKPEIQEDMWDRKIRKQQTRQKPAKGQLKPLRVGQPVLVQDWHSKKNSMEQGKVHGSAVG